MHDVTLIEARSAIEAALHLARERGLAPLAVAVLDPGGHLIAAVREDGAGHSGIDIAMAKARGALSFRMTSRAVGDFIGDNVLLGTTLSAALGGQLLPIPGAILIERDGRMAGVIAAAGDAPGNDEAAALAGRAAVPTG